MFFLMNKLFLLLLSRGRIAKDRKIPTPPPPPPPPSYIKVISSKRIVRESHLAVACGGTVLAVEVANRLMCDCCVGPSRWGLELSLWLITEVRTKDLSSYGEGKTRLLSVVSDIPTLAWVFL